MAWKTLAIRNPANLRIENHQLQILQDESVSFPLEDLAVLLLESPAVTLSSALLARLAEHDIALLVCDARHLPRLVALPYYGPSRLTAIHRQQLALTLPFKKRAWQAIVKQKIANQIEALRLTNRSDSPRIRSLLSAVRSGDPDNLEARAARQYFPLLFGSDFSRGAEDTYNAALDYGYAVLRAAVLRALAAHGFILSQGLHHSSELNPFNLADDLLEPARPLVDLYVATTISRKEEFSRDHRAGLVSLLYHELLIEDKRQTALRAMDIMAASLVSACKSPQPSLLKLPALLPLQLHENE